MTMHKFHLNAVPFELVKCGLKTVESRLYDERRQRIEIGDTITFVDRETKGSLKVRVTHLHRAPTFRELFSQHDPVKFGGESVEELERSIDVHYGYDDQLRYGVLGIEFVKL